MFPSRILVWFSAYIGFCEQSIKISCTKIESEYRKPFTANTLPCQFSSFFTVLNEALVSCRRDLAAQEGLLVHSAVSKEAVNTTLCCWKKPHLVFAYHNVPFWNIYTDFFWIHALMKTFIDLFAALLYIHHHWQPPICAHRVFYLMSVTSVSTLHILKIWSFSFDIAVICK